MHGKGTFTNAQGHQQDGVWEKGVLIGNK